MSTPVSGGYRFLVRAGALWCAVAVGTLVFSAVVAPMLFDALPNDRTAAGRIAGRGFEAAYAVTFAASLVVCIALALTRRSWRRFEPVLGGLLATASALQLFWIAQAIARRGVGWPWSFGSLHATAGVVHLGLSIGALILSWRLLSKA